MSKSYKQLELHFSKQLNGSFLGSFLSAFRGQGVEFESLREYIPGDSIKSIDWKATAKMGDVFVRTYQEEKDLQVLFIIENTSSLGFGSEEKTKRDLLIEVFFLLAYSSISGTHSVGVIIGGIFLDFAKSKTNIIKTIQLLENDMGLDEATEIVTKLNIKNTLIFVLGDTLEPDINKFKFLQARNEIVNISIFDYFENHLSTENFSFSGYGFGKILGIFGVNGKKLEDYSTVRQKKYSDLQKKLGKYNISSLSLDTRTDIFGALYTFFESHKRIK